MTETAQMADIVLPATTQLEHDDIHKSYGHYYALANLPAIAPLGEAKPNSEVFRLLAGRMGFTDACFRDSDEDIARQAFDPQHPNMRGIGWDLLKQHGSIMLYRIPDRNERDYWGNIIPGINVYRNLDKKGLCVICDPIIDDDGFEWSASVELTYPENKE